MRGYIVAVVATAAGVLLRLVLFGVLGDQAPFFPFVLAVIVTAWYGGLKPGLLATVLGAVLGIYFSLPPANPPFVEQLNRPIVAGLFLIIGATASWLCGALHTARRRNEEKQRKLEQAEEHIRSVVNHIIDRIITIDESGIVQSLNPAAEKLFGYKAEEVVGQNVKMLTPEPYHSEHDAYVANYLRTGKAKIIDIGREVEGRRKDGSTFPMELAVSEFRLGERRYFTGIVRDIADRREMEEALRHSEAQFRQLADAMPQIVWGARPDGYIDYYNERWYEFTGFNRGEYGQASWEPILHPGDVQRCVETYFGCVKAEQPYQIEYRFKDRRTGSYRWFLGRALPVRDDSGRIVRWFGTCTDIDDTKKAQEALRESEQRLAAELEAMTRLHSLSTRLLSADDLRTALDDVLENAILTSGADFGNIQLYNRQIKALEIVAQRGFQQDFLDYFRTVQIDEGSACAQAMQSGERIIIEDVDFDHGFEPHREVAAAAGFRAVQSTPLKSREGSILGMLSTHFRLPQRVSQRNQRLLDLYARHAADFIERLRSDEALRESEQRFARFMEHLPGLAWIKDLQGRYLYANDTAMRAFRCTREGLYGKTDDEVFPPETAAQFKANDRKALAGETGVQIIETLEQEDGIVHHSVVSKFPILGPQGGQAFIGGMAIDITDRLRAEEVLAESEQRFRQLAENITQVFWMADPPVMKILYISPAYEQIWGRSCQSLYEQPRSFLDAVHPEDRERVRVASLEKHGRGEPTDEEYRVIRPDGTVRWVRDRAFPVKDAAGQVYRMVGIAEDCTEKKRAEEALKQADRRKDEFLATLAHELRNPLAPIRNAVELLRRADGDATLMETARCMMERQLAQMVRLIDDLLDISRITRGKLQLRKERIELAAVVRSALEAARSLIDAQAHQLTITLPPEPIYLDADPIRLAEVFSNLLNNAAKYTEKGGHIWLTAEQQDGEVVVSVRDTGIGIAAEHLLHVFEMFSQVAPALERSQGGLGIGLALVRGFVELHGGSIEARSTGPGKGSEFIVRLPVVQAPAQARLAPSGDGDRSRSLSKCRILVADDLRDSVDSLAMMLRLAGHDTQAAYDGLEAVQAAATFRPDVVLLDIGMPKMNGYEAARHIREQPWGKGIALIALTGWGQEEDKRRALAAGFDHHLTKPVEAAALEKLLALITVRHRSVERQEARHDA
jgi:PAS domain S-box-containing protein